MSWSSDVGPVGVLGTRPGPPPKPDAPRSHQHRRRRPAVLAGPQAAAAHVTGLLNPAAPGRAYRRYWV
jgi:hypothetical protein